MPPKSKRKGLDCESEAKRQLRLESERNCREQIQAKLALPMHKRTYFLRMRLPGGGSCL